MLAVVKTTKKGVPVSIVGTATPGGWATLPDGSMVSPARDGDAGECYAIMKIVEPDIPEGSYPSGARSLELVDGVPTWVQELSQVERHFPELTHRQFWLAAWDIGITKQSITAKVLSSYPEGERDRIAMEVELATTFSRNHPLVDELCVMSGLSPVELDALWEWASSI